MFGLPIWIVSVGFGVLVCVFFALISLFSKPEDYLLDDYTEEDAPDNVRVIEKEVRVVDNSEIDRLSKELTLVSDKSRDLESNLSQKETQLSEYKVMLETVESNITNITNEKNNLVEEKDNLSNKITSLQSLVDESNKDIENRKEVISQLEKQINSLEDKCNLKVKENEELITKNSNLDKEKSLVKQSMLDQEKEASELISRIKKEKSKLEEDLTKVEKNRKEYQELFKKSKGQLDSLKTTLKEVEDTSKKAMEDRDHFSKLVDQKEEKISKLQGEISILTESNSHVYDGTDEYGHFYDVYNMVGYPKNITNKIQDINDELEAGQFGYYVYNNHVDKESLEIGDISNIDRYLQMANQKETNGKYSVFVIMNNKVYPFKIH